eukprot:760308-Hanusia_phi.AAC.4
MSETGRETSAVLRIVSELHEQAREGQRNLVELGRAIEVVARKPQVRSHDKLSIAVVGNGDIATSFIEDYLGTELKNKRLGTENKAVVVRTGAQSEVDDSLTAAVDGLSFCLHENVESERLDSQLLTFIRMPSVFGRSQFEDDVVIQAVREIIQDPERQKSMRTIFDQLDTDKDHYLSRTEFLDGIESMSSKVSRKQIEQLFDAIDLDKDDVMEYDEFLYAMKPSEIPYKYDLEDFFMQIAEAVELVVVLLDPRVTRINVRELTLYEKLYESHKSKLFFGCFLQDRHLGDQHMLKYIQSTRKKMSGSLHDVKFNKLPVVWTSKSKHDLEVSNSLQDIHDLIALKVDKILEEKLIAPCQRNLANICSKMFDVKDSDLRENLSSLVDQLVLSTNRDTSYFQPMLKLHRVATTIQSAIKRFSSVQMEPSTSIAGLLQGLHIPEEGSGADEENQLPELPAGWEVRNENGRELFVNSRLKITQPTRPTEPRSSLKVFLHAIDNLYDDPRNSYCISSLSRELGAAIDKPLLQQKVFVLLLGNGDGPANFLHWYTGSRMQNAELGTTHHFTIVTRGDTPSLVKGAAALDQIKSPEISRMASVAGMDRALAFEAIPCHQSDDGDFDAIVFIRAPAIEGRDFKLEATTLAAFERLRENFTSSNTTLRQEFESLCSNFEDPKNATISLFDFARGVQEKHLDLSQQEINAIYSEIDSTGQGEVGWEEFSSAFLRADSNQPVANLEEALSKIADFCGLIIIFGDPTRMSYDTKEMSVYANMLEMYKEKCRFYCFLPVDNVAEDDLKRHVNKMKGALKKHCKPLSQTGLRYFYRNKYALDKHASEYVSAGEAIKMDICHVVDKQLHSMLKSVDLHLAKLFENLMDREPEMTDHLKYTLLNMAADLSDLKDLSSFALRKILNKYGRKSSAQQQRREPQETGKQTSERSLRPAELVEETPSATKLSQEAEAHSMSPNAQVAPLQAAPPQAIRQQSPLTEVVPQQGSQPSAGPRDQRNEVAEAPTLRDVAPTGKLLAFIANVHDDSKMGLKLLSSCLRLDEDISTPHPSRKVNVLLVGSGDSKLAFIEQYTKSRCKGMKETHDKFLVVQSGSNRDVMRGENALHTLFQGFGGKVDRLSRLNGIKNAFVAEQIDEDLRQFVLVNFIVAPELRGVLRKSDANLSDALVDMARQLGQHREDVNSRLLPKLRV